MDVTQSTKVPGSAKNLGGFEDILSSHLGRLVANKNDSVFLFDHSGDAQEQMIEEIEENAQEQRQARLRQRQSDIERRRRFSQLRAEDLERSRENYEKVTDSERNDRAGRLRLLDRQLEDTEDTDRARSHLEDRSSVEKAGDIENPEAAEGPLARMEQEAEYGEISDAGSRGDRPDATASASRERASTFIEPSDRREAQNAGGFFDSLKGDTAKGTVDPERGAGVSGDAEVASGREANGNRPRIDNDTAQSSADHARDRGIETSKADEHADAAGDSRPDELLENIPHRGRASDAAGDSRPDELLENILRPDRASDAAGDSRPDELLENIPRPDRASDAAGDSRPDELLENILRPDRASDRQPRAERDNSTPAVGSVNEPSRINFSNTQVGESGDTREPQTNPSELLDGTAEVVERTLETLETALEGVEEFRGAFEDVLQRLEELLDRINTLRDGEAPVSSQLLDSVADDVVATGEVLDRKLDEVIETQGGDRLAAEIEKALGSRAGNESGIENMPAGAAARQPDFAAASASSDSPAATSGPAPEESGSSRQFPSGNRSSSESGAGADRHAGDGEAQQSERVYSLAERLRSAAGRISRNANELPGRELFFDVRDLRRATPDPRQPERIHVSDGEGLQANSSTENSRDSGADPVTPGRNTSEVISEQSNEGSSSAARQRPEANGSQSVSEDPDRFSALLGGDQSDQTRGASPSAASATGGGESEARAALHNMLREHGNSEIVRQARVILKDDHAGELRLTLKPEGLGSVRIRMELEDNRVDLRILVENSNVRDAFRDNLAELQRSFEAEGFDTGEFSVDVESESGEDGEYPGRRETTSDAQSTTGRHGRAMDEFSEAVPSVDPYSGLERHVNVMV